MPGDVMDWVTEPLEQRQRKDVTTSLCKEGHIIASEKPVVKLD
jgi:hypothetical protein